MPIFTTRKAQNETEIPTATPVIQNAIPVIPTATPVIQNAKPVIQNAIPVKNKKEIPNATLVNETPVIPNAKLLTRAELVTNATPVACDTNVLYFFHVSNNVDTYNIFNKIKNGLYEPLKNILYDIGVVKAIKGVTSGISTKEDVISTEYYNVRMDVPKLQNNIPFLIPRETGNTILNVKLNASMEQLNKYRYLLNNLYSTSFPFTPLQYACIYNRQDIVMLILEHLIASNPTYIKNYINYVAKFALNKQTYYCRAIDLINTSYKIFKNMGITSTTKQTLSAVGNVAKDFATMNWFQGTAKAASKVAKLGKNVINKTAQAATGRNIIEEILLQLGSEKKRELEKCTVYILNNAPPTVIYHVNRKLFGVQRKTGGKNKQTKKNSRVSRNKRKTRHQRK